MFQRDKENHTEYVRWSVFVFIMGLIVAGFSWFSNLVINSQNTVNTKLDNIQKDIANIDKRTSILEKFDSSKRINPQSFDEKLMKLITKVP